MVLLPPNVGCGGRLIGTRQGLEVSREEGVIELGPRQFVVNGGPRLVTSLCATLSNSTTYCDRPPCVRFRCHVSTWPS